MYRVIIVDDEPVIRKGLRETIEWDSLGLEVAGEAADGIEALKLIKAVRPEILITDIRMPDMDGIQLIQEVKKLDFDVKITILSGYSEYDYLKAAIRLGVDNYLLKPIDNDELISNLKNAVSEIEKEAVVGLQIRQGSELLRSNTLRRLVTGNISLEELKEKADFLNIAVNAEVFACAACAVPRQVPAAQREQLSRSLNRDIAVDLPGGSMISFVDGDGNLALLMAHDDVPDGREGVRRALEAVMARADGERIPLTVGVGRPATHLEGIQASYESAKESLEYGAFLKNSGIIWYDRVPQEAPQDRAFERIDYDRMKGCIRRGDQDGLKKCLEETLDAMASEMTLSLNQAQNALMHIAVRMTECFHETYGSMNTFRDPIDFDFAQLFALRRFSEMRAWLIELCGKLFSENKMVLGKGTSVVGLAVAYIAEHYREGVTLKQVALHCHINTSYLGQIFKKETGSAFTDYVNAMRIREAQRLLANPTLKVYEIAEQVGFTDYHYFLKIFKKVTGITPTDLRN